MSASTDLPSVSPSIKLDSESRKILGPAGNRVKVKEEEKEKESLKKKDLVEKKPKSFVKLVKRSPQIVVRKNDESADSSCSSKSSSSDGSSVKIPSFKKREKHDPNRLKLQGGEAPLTTLSIPFKRCDWITQFSDPLYVSFHDEEWGVPVHEDGKLFELLVLSQASAELTWPEILYKRDKFRKLFENFNPSSIAKFPEDRLLSGRRNGGLLLSEQKLRAIVGNAVALLKIQQEFGSFSSYCWRFLNHTPIKNGFRYRRQIPTKTPKSEAMSKDMMQRGFRCVGPIVVYSFMQISGMVNDHLISCFRYMECNSINVIKDPKQETDDLDE
ncbi:uncharacterized protein LOC112510153 [Cynara cardunculus var. scolymus]|uniref:DNA glycosylase n=1 Tax=Cynara cardunculus var. scolymus TaxID=59895 RepID=A0A118K3W2_CYNCS|nr:uncharacterized protein LOC112510153 [Cynara cardunculus var. scolymus]KVI06570.1 DNA glycosylase [Cynara cardunculus var. scolymus]